MNSQSKIESRRGKNRYGVDMQYFHRWFERSLNTLENYRPDELARELARMSKTAASSVLLEPEFNSVKSSNGLVIQPELFTFSFKGFDLKLTPHEYRFLKSLYIRPGEAVNRDILADEASGYDYDGSSRVVDSMVVGIRKKIEWTGCTIKTVRSAGYMLVKNELKQNVDINGHPYNCDACNDTGKMHSDGTVCIVCDA